MRTLFLMRHAKAEHHDIRGDKSRHLSHRGRIEAAEVGAKLRGRGIEHVLCSTSQRTRDTLACLGLGDVPVDYLDALYMGHMGNYRQYISEVDDEITGLLVIGHAPVIPHLAAQLAVSSQPDAAAEIQYWFPTSGLAEFTLDCPWSELATDHDCDSIQLASMLRLDNH